MLTVVALVSALGWLGRQPAPPTTDRVHEPANEPAGVATASEPVLAVLPFDDLSEARDQGAFADGLADSLLHQLAQVRDLKVIARTSSFSFRGNDATVFEIARRLGANVVLEGSVQRSGDRLRVIAQLIDARDESHLWSGTFDRTAGELFEVQDEIAGQVTIALTEHLLPESVAGDRLSLEAFELISEGRQALEAGTLEGAQRAVTLFERAVELAPGYANGYVFLLDALGQRGRLSDWSLEDERDAAQVLLDKALSLSPNSVEVQRKLGEWLFFEEDYPGAESAYRRALEINPNDARVRGAYGYMLYRLDRLDEALAQFRLALRLDPLSRTSPMMLARIYWAMGRSEESIVTLKENIRRHPEYPDNYGWLATFLLQMGRTGEATRIAERAHELDPGSAHGWFRKCEFYLQLGDVEAGERCTEELTAALDVPARELYLRALVHSARGEWEQRRELLQQLYDQDYRLTLIPDLTALAWSRSDCGRALAILEQSYPDLFESPPQVSRVQTLGAMVAGYCLDRQGRPEQSEVLLAAVKANMDRTRMLRAPHAVSGIERAQLLALSGETDAALDELERLIENNWRYYWWGLAEHPFMASLHGKPRLEALLQQLEAGVARERRWYQTHGDDPLPSVLIGGDGTKDQADVMRSPGRH